MKIIKAILKPIFEFMKDWCWTVEDMHEIAKIEAGICNCKNHKEF